MKITAKIKRGMYVLLLSLVALSGLTGILTAIAPQQASAATVVSAPIIYDLSGAALKNHDQVANKCVPTINSPQGQTWGGNTRTVDIIASGNNVAGRTSGAKTLFQQIQNGARLLVIDFIGANGATEPGCGLSLSFYRNVASPDPNTFYGIWNYNNGPVGGNVFGDFGIVTGTVDPVKGTLSFELPQPDNNGGFAAALKYYSATGGRATTFTTDATTTGWLKNAAYFPKGGGGTTSTAGVAKCLEAAPKNIQTCLDGHTAGFINSAAILFDGQQYIASQWGGDKQMVYSLSPDSTDTALANLNPKFIVDTTSDGGDNLNINIDDGVSGSHDKLANLENVINTNKTIKVSFTIHGGTINDNSAKKGKVPVSTSFVRLWATYYPKDDTVRLQFTSAASNEQPYFGVYTRTDAKHYSLPNSGPLKRCGTQPGATKNQFIFTQDPRTMDSIHDGVANAVWALVDTSTCSQTTGHVDVLIAAADKSAPTGNPPPVDKNAAETPTCESSGFSLSWIMCPIINGLASAADGVYDNVIKPLLITRSININDPNDKASQAIFKVWSNFRIYGDIFLVIALLVIVFGQSIGGGMIDAYTAKKVLPRLLIAAILINLSIYITALLVDLTNIVGGGLITLITAPFSQSGNFDISLNGTTSGLGLVALVGGGIWAVAAFGALLEFLFAFLLLPAFLIILSVMITVLLRRGLIIFLVIVSPVAFALYCLPNTEQYFRKWWELLFKTLLVYPIIAALFAIAKVLSVTIGWGGETSGLASTFADILSVAALFVPLALIPFAFRIAGGVLGKLHEVTSNYGKRAHQAMLGNQNDPTSWRNRARYKLGDRNTQLRERAVNQGKDSSNPFRRGVGRSMNWGNLQAKRSMYNKQRSEMLQNQIATGDDTNIRDLFIAQDAASGQWFRRMDLQKQADGSLTAVPGASAIYKDAASGRTAHNKAMSLYGGDKSAVQDALYYEWKKTSFDPNAMNNLVGQYDQVLGEHNFNRSEGAEMGKAVGFRHQGQSLASKHSTFGYNEATGDWGMHVNHTSLAKEGAFNIGTYQWSNQDVTTFDELGVGYQQASTILAGHADSSNETIIQGQTGALAEYNGQSVGQLRNSQRRISEIAVSTNPDQMMGGRPSLDRAHVDPDGTPDAGYGGVSNAPVEVQAAARRLYAQIHGNRRGNGGNGTGNPGNGGGPAGPTAGPTGGPTTPQAPPPPGGGLITPGSPDFNIPPGQRPPG